MATSLSIGLIFATALVLILPPVFYVLLAWHADCGTDNRVPPPTWRGA